MISFTEEAIQDIQDAILWYEEQRVGLSYDFELCLEAGINEILRLPTAFQFKYRNVKVVYIKRFPYAIHYIERLNDIIVVGIFHTSRSPKNWKKRL